jgi:hypothetical protein
MATKKKAFDAVAESRRWKEAVARKTNGMSSSELFAFFNRDKALSRTRALRKKSPRCPSIN